MKIVIAPDSFKESLTALEVANAIETGFKRIFPNAEYMKLPMADGGECCRSRILRNVTAKCEKFKILQVSHL